MGLDMYAHTTAQEIGDVDFEHPEDAVQIHYWRKHPDLHGWMERLYFQKGGADPQFNCAAVRLTEEDLRALDRTLRLGELPHTEGFFFGVSQPEEYPGDVAFVRKALEAIERGFRVYYTSWW